MLHNHELIVKYNVPGPRYTSYPTVPHWSNMPTVEEWLRSVAMRFNETNADQGINIYIHLPFCESLCTYCGCNTRITKNHAVEVPYVDALLKEWAIYMARFNVKPRIREIHLGGGTPTFFSPDNLKRLLDGIMDGSEKAPDFEFSFEAHPANTTREHLQTLFDIGFTRLSLGVQDFNEKVQKAINRYQTVDDVLTVMRNAKEIGYGSINIDIIYGLPFQTLESIEQTVSEICKLRPERIAYYSYAHVPWLKPGQRGFTDMDLPTDSYKRALYELGKELLINADYVEVGMDHFALREDELYRSLINQTLHRNFMGYTSRKSDLLIGLGVSSISDSWDMFAQNAKTLPEYYKLLEENTLPIVKGHILSNEDLLIRQLILDLMCQFSTSLAVYKKYDLHYAIFKSKIKPLIEDGIAEVLNDQLIITEAGKPFVRNVCMTLDAYLGAQTDNSQRFSSTV
jgi:oxygen-independent coproporphyrinogen III oxidase